MRYGDSMPSFVTLLRAVNVGGTGKLPMRSLKAVCEAAGFIDVRTYIASGNVVFSTALDEAEIKARVTSGLKAETGSAIGVLVRSAGEMVEILQANPFKAAPPNHVVVIFLDEPPDIIGLEQITGKGQDEDVRLGRRELYVRYSSSMARSTLRIPAAKFGTARNMNTVAKLVSMADA